MSRLWVKAGASGNSASHALQGAAALQATRMNKNQPASRRKAPVFNLMPQGQQGLGGIDRLQGNAAGLLSLSHELQQRVIEAAKASPAGVIQLIAARIGRLASLCQKPVNLLVYPV